MVGMDSRGRVDGDKAPSVAGRLGLSLFFLFFFALGSLFELFIVREFGRAVGQRAWRKVPVIGVVLIGGAVYQFLAIFTPRPTLELSCGTISLGGAAELRWRVTGRTSRMDEFTVTLRGVEEAKYRKGTSTYTDRNTFYEMELYRTSDATEIASGQVGFVLPQDTMHSFEAENNRILWSLDVHGRIRHWPDVKESFKVTVTPTAA